MPRWLAVLFDALHAQLACSVHRFLPFGKASLGYRSDARILAARPAASTMAIWRLAAPFSSEVSEVVSCCLIVSQNPHPYRFLPCLFCDARNQVLREILGGVILTAEKIHLGNPQIKHP